MSDRLAGEQLACPPPIAEPALTQFIAPSSLLRSKPQFTATWRVLDDRSLEIQLLFPATDGGKMVSHDRLCCGLREAELLVLEHSLQLGAFPGKPGRQWFVDARDSWSVCYQETLLRYAIRPGQPVTLRVSLCGVTIRVHHRPMLVVTMEFDGCVTGSSRCMVPAPEGYCLGQVIPFPRL